MVIQSHGKVIVSNMKNKSRIQYNNYASSADNILITSDYFLKFICKYNQPFSISDLKASAVFELIHTTLFLF